jgi:2Fe-2S iron-sulfur cluster binding domain
MIRLRVNGVEQSFDGDPQMPLLWYLRDELGLRGTKFGCGVGLCGACTVNLGGKAIRSCVTAMSSAGGSENHNHRVAGARRPPSSPKGLDSAQRSPVRLLPVRPDDAGCGAARE